jgi:3-oxoacyl-[acyl-carrier-protein] synthase III
MACTKIKGPQIAAVSTCVPARRFDNLLETSQFAKEEVKKVVALAGVKARRLAGNSICSSDLCLAAANKMLDSLGWERDSIGALIMVTQSPDYLLPSTACVLHKHLGLSDECAAFDLGLGCSGYPYGLWLGAMMINTGEIKRVLVLHGETPSRFSDESDRSVSLLFGDTGSATALEGVDSTTSADWFFKLHTDGSGFHDMIIEAGGFRNRFDKNPRKYCVSMNGASVFNFTIKRVPPLIRDTLEYSKTELDEVDYYIFHQSNQFIIKHITKKMKIPDEKVPMTLGEFGNTGGSSIPLTITMGDLVRPVERSLKMMLLGYGVGLSWASALIELGPDAILEHCELSNRKEEKNGA